MIIKEAEYNVRVTLTTSIQFSSIERDSVITEQDAIANAFGSMPDSFWDALKGEGWSIEAEATLEGKR